MTDTTEDDATERSELQTLKDGPELPPVSPAATAGAVSRRFERGELLGVGAMGEVVECHDRRLGRVVAEKTLQDVKSSHARWRFLREVQVQAQLEHPSIVPVYELDVGEGRAPSFTMKRVQGVTLAAAIDAARKGEVMPRFAPRRLLQALASVCLAVDYAHRRGVIHRDLKPSNIMLGAYGEVYVLDWGVARVLEDDQADVDISSTDIAHLELVDDEGTRVVGTPGFIAPEVLASESRGTPPSDVYALGAILFQILSGELLHGGNALARIESTRTGVDVHARARASSLRIPPELLTVCERAVAPLGQRYEDCRSMHDDLQAYLDGDRDLALRRDMADDLARTAISQLDEAAGLNRQAVLRDLVAALALEPTHGAALRGLRRLLSEPPAEPPPDVVHRLAELEDEHLAAVSKPASWSGIIGMPVALGLTLFMGVRSFAVFAVVAVLAVVLPTVVRTEGRLASRRAGSARRVRHRRRDILPVALMAVAISLVSAVAGPFVLLPAVATSLGIVRVLRDPRQPWLVIALMLAAVFVPAVLMATGVVEPSYSFGPEGWLIRPLAVELPEIPTMVWASACAGVIVTSGVLIAARYRRELDATELRNQLYLWQLEQVLPDPASAGADPTGRSQPRGQ
jgi:serine/threonine-protein kinase